MASLNTTSCAAFDGTLVIGDVVKTVGGSPDGVPKISTCVEAGIVGAPAKTPITALVECKSTLGGFVVPRMTQAQRDAMTAGTVPDGTMVYVTDLVNFYLRVNNAWVAPGIAAGEIIGPGVSTQNAVATWNNLLGTSLQNTTLIYNAGALSGLTSVVNAVGAVALPSYTFAGRLTHGMWSNAAGQLNFSTTNGEQFRILDGGALTVNSLQVAGSATGAAVTMSSVGTDANIDITLSTKGNGGFNLNFGARPALFVKNVGGALVNYLEVAPALTGNPVTIVAEGTDANIALQLAPTGNLPVFIPNGSNLGLGASFAAADTNTMLIQLGTAPVAGVANAMKLYAATAVAAGPINARTIGIFSDVSPVSAVAPTAPNRTLAIVVNGTTYYLAAKTTND